MSSSARVESRGALYTYRRLYPYLLIAPALLVMMGVLVYPFLNGVWISLHRDNLFSPTRPFIGLENYLAVFAIPQVGGVLRISLVWTIGSVVTEAILGMILALVLTRSFRGRDTFRALLLIPWIMPAVVTAVIWRWLLHAELGAFNAAFGWLGLFAEKQNWLGDPNTALWAVMATNVWRGFPFWMTMMLAGLQAIEPDQYQAARVDGASSWQLFRFITLPNMHLVLTITSILSFVGNFNNFTLIYALTKGGPVDSTKILPIYIWETAFQFSRFGEASAMATFFALIMAVVIIFYARVVRLRSNE